MPGNNYQMDIFKGNKSQKSTNDFYVETTSHKVNISGIFYVILEIGGLTFSIFLLWHNMREMMPVYGTIMASILGGTVSQFILVYGYNVVRRNM